MWKKYPGVASIQKLIPELPQSISQLFQSCSNVPATNLSTHFPLCSCCSSQMWQRELAPAKLLPICSLQSITSKPPNISSGLMWPFPMGSPLSSVGCLTGSTGHDVQLRPKGQIKQWASLPRYTTYGDFFLNLFLCVRMHLILYNENKQKSRFTSLQSYYVHPLQRTSIVEKLSEFRLLYGYLVWI